MARCSTAERARRAVGTVPGPARALLQGAGSSASPVQPALALAAPGIAAISRVPGWEEKPEPSVNQHSQSCSQVGSAPAMGKSCLPQPLPKINKCRGTDTLLVSACLSLPQRPALHCDTLRAMLREQQSSISSLASTGVQGPHVRLSRGQTVGMS